MSTPVTVPLGGAPQGDESDDVQTYVASVRARLDDLSAEEVEELTGGLEADLSEALGASGDSPRERFGDAETYADELRAAAGLGPRPAGGDRGGAVVAIDGLVRRRRAELEALWHAPQFAPVRELLVTLRPVWWVLRGWLGFQIVGAVLGGVDPMPNGILGMLLLLALVVGSVQVGRRSPPREQGRRSLLFVANVIAVIALLALIAGAATNGYDEAPMAGYATESPPGPLGEVRNIFPYDAQGRPLRDVQLFDQDGNPLVPGEHQRYYEDDQGRSWQLRPASDVYGTTRWNAYPLRRADDSAFDPETGESIEGPVVPEAHPRPAVPPLLAAPTATIGPTPSTAPSPSTALSPSTAPTLTAAPPTPAPSAAPPPTAAAPRATP